jgi:hypothetical protein
MSPPHVEFARVISNSSEQSPGRESVRTRRRGNIAGPAARLPATAAPRPAPRAAGGPHRKGELSGAEAGRFRRAAGCVPRRSGPTNRPIRPSWQAPARHRRFGRTAARCSSRRRPRGRRPCGRSSGDRRRRCRYDRRRATCRSTRRCSGMSCRAWCSERSQCRPGRPGDQGDPRPAHPSPFAEISSAARIPSIHFLVVARSSNLPAWVAAWTAIGQVAGSHSPAAQRSEQHSSPAVHDAPSGWQQMAEPTPSSLQREPGQQRSVPLGGQDSPGGMHSSVTHLPRTQSSSRLQRFPHRPQFLRSNSTSVQRPPQQRRPRRHRRPHLPQWSSLPNTLTQVPLQHASPLPGQSAARRHPAAAGRAPPRATLPPRPPPKRSRSAARRVASLPARSRMKTSNRFQFISCDPITGWSGATRTWPVTSVRRWTTQRPAGCRRVPQSRPRGRRGQPNPLALSPQTLTVAASRAGPCQRR